MSPDGSLRCEGWRVKSWPLVDGREAVLFVKEHHPVWLNWVAGCCWAQHTKPPGVPITAWDVAHSMRKKTAKPLGPLVRWGILEHAGAATRQGNSRYYFVRPGVREGMKNVKR